MNKEKLLEVAWFNREDETYTMQSKDLKEFFSQNVVIPKGENPHSDAEVIHLLAENMSLQVESNIHETTWKPQQAICKEVAYRIKPSEPIFEWQWDTKLPDETWSYYKESDKTHFTDDEIGAAANWLCKVEHTKRIRQ
jgi:hypothetical protein